MGSRIPSYRLHKTSGRAVVTIEGRDIYLGIHGTVESRLKYSEVIARHAGGLAPETTKPSSISINELSLAFMKHAEGFYLKDGKQTSEVDCYRLATRPLVDLYGFTSVSDFGPLKLMAVRQKMVDNGNLCRKSINQAVTRIRSIFKWGVAREMVPATILTGLQALEPLKRGRTIARETKKRKPVPDEVIQQVKNIVSPRTADLIDLQLLSGARSGELLMLTSGMIDRSNDIWIARLVDHKTAHHDLERILVFGPRAQLILRKYISNNPDSRLFRLRRDTYGKSVREACLKLGVPVWTPHWLRHNAGTMFREQCGLDVAQATLGHTSADITQLYARLSLTKVVDALRKFG